MAAISIILSLFGSKPVVSKSKAINLESFRECNNSLDSNK